MTTPPAPAFERMDRRPMYQKIADLYRAEILSGQRAPGTVLPSVNELAALHEVSRDTAAAAISHLLVAKLVTTSHRGTFVAGADRVTWSARERSVQRPGGRPGGEGETVTVREKGIVLAPAYVGEIFSLPPNGMVIRREETARRGGRLIRLTVDWMPGPSGQVDIGELLSPGPIEGGTLGCVARAFGRQVAAGEDSWEARAADEREATALALPAGAPVLAVVTIFSDADGHPLLYTESVHPAGLVLTAAYELADEPAG